MDYRPYLSLTDEEIHQADPGEMNLKLAVDLPGAKGIDIPALVHQLNKWSNAVRLYTDKHRIQFQRNPERFDNSIGQFRIMCMLTVIQRDFGVRYQPELVEGEWDARDSRTLFIHGPLTGYGGTCANLPILYLALAWRLKYPLHIVRCAQHLFLRWEGEGERFNFDATSQGFIVYSDQHYVKWPLPALPEHLLTGEFLTNLSPSLNLGLYFLQRALVLRDHLRTDEGRVCTKLAAQHNHYYRKEILVQDELHELTMQLCRRFGVPHTQLLSELCFQLDWKWIAHDFCLLAKKETQLQRRRFAFNHLLRVVRLRMRDLELVRETVKQNHNKNVLFKEAHDVSFR